HLGLTGLKPIEPALARSNRANVAGERGPHVRRLETGAVFERRLVRSHFFRVEHRDEHLILERARAAVPEERLAVAGIDERRRIARALGAMDASCDGAAVAERAFGLVAGRARDRAVG